MLAAIVLAVKATGNIAASQLLDHYMRVAENMGARVTEMMDFLSGGKYSKLKEENKSLTAALKSRDAALKSRDAAHADKMRVAVLAMSAHNSAEEISLMLGYPISDVQKILKGDGGEV
jgi:hypothetical protein